MHHHNTIILQWEESNVSINGINRTVTPHLWNLSVLMTLQHQSRWHYSSVSEKMFLRPQKHVQPSRQRKPSAPGQRAKVSDCKPSREQHSSGSFQTSSLKEVIPHCFEDSRQEIPTAGSWQSCYCYRNPGRCIRVIDRVTQIPFYHQWFFK